LYLHRAARYKAPATGGFMATLLKLLAFTFLAVIDLFVCFYGTTLAMSYLYTVDWAPIAF
jgi:hypothetical protein